MLRSRGAPRSRGALGSDGAALVEFALCSAILFSLLIGIMELSIAFFTYHYVNDAAREASRWAMVRGSTSCTNTPGLTDCDATGAEVQTFVRNLGYPSIVSSNTTVNTAWCTVSATQPASWSGCSATGSNAPGNVVQVQVIYAFPLSIPFVSKQTLSIQSTSEMVISQ
ncbi:MAG: TadE/TadG family type IV pilus assembly protein [Silvibacterium sp.]